VLASLVLAATASADADPASDSLYTGRVFLPLSTKVSPRLAQRLAADALAAEQAGKPVRVALIASPIDLGGVPTLFGRPPQYARFLGAELQFVYAGQVLVVMPQRAALAQHGRLIANADVVHAKVGSGGDGIARTAIVLVEKLSGVKAAPGVTVPQPTTTSARVHVPTSPRPTAKKSGGVPLWVSAAIAVGAVCFLLAPGLVLVRRRRSRPLAQEPPPPAPDDPYRYTGPL
jgi:hypothetical protein